MAQLFSLDHIHTMSKSRHFILMLANILMLVAGLAGIVGFILLTDIHSRHGYSGYASRDQIMATTDVARLQLMGISASDGWMRFSAVVDANRWFFLGFGAVLLIGSVVLTPKRLKDKP